MYERIIISLINSFSNSEINDKQPGGADWQKDALMGVHEQAINEIAKAGKIKKRDLEGLMRITRRAKNG